MKLFREQLTANQEIVHEVNSSGITILNIGDGDLYVNFDKEATTESLLIPEGMGRTFNMSHYVKNVHAISDSTPIIQIDALR